MKSEVNKMICFHKAVNYIKRYAGNMHMYTKIQSTRVFRCSSSLTSSLAKGFRSTLPRSGVDRKPLLAKMCKEKTILCYFYDNERILIDKLRFMPIFCLYIHEKFALYNAKVTRLFASVTHHNAKIMRLFTNITR